jgi:cytochrome c-type biogenesis protein CcmH/NrfG
MAMGRIYYNTKDTLKAEEHYRKAYNLDPENPNRIWDLADVLIRYEVNIEEGMAITQKMLDQNPYSTGFLRLKALALHKLGRHQEALQILKELEKRTISYFYPIHNEIREVEQALAKTNQ